MINVSTSLWLRSHVRWSGSTVWDIGRKHRIQHVVTKMRSPCRKGFSGDDVFLRRLSYAFHALLFSRECSRSGFPGRGFHFGCSHVFACSVSSAAVLPKRGRLTCKQPCPDTSIILPSAMQGCGPLVAEHDGFGLCRYGSSTQI